MKVLLAVSYYMTISKLTFTQRNFGTISMFGFSVILMASWEAILSTAALGLTNGGSAGFLYTCLATWLGFITVYASLGEMGSMAPTSGRYTRFLVIHAEHG
jgi:hypothetical protein